MPLFKKKEEKAVESEKQEAAPEEKALSHVIVDKAITTGEGDNKRVIRPDQKTVGHWKAVHGDVLYFIIPKENEKDKDKIIYVRKPTNDMIGTAHGFVKTDSMLELAIAVLNHCPVKLGGDLEVLEDGDKNHLASIANWYRFYLNLSWVEVGEL